MITAPTPPTPELFERSFPGRAEEVPAARRWVVRCLSDLDVDVGDVALAVSELAGNAVTHSRSGLGGVFTVRVVLVPRQMVQVEVCDQGPLPHHRDPETYRGCKGQGWCLVRELSTDCGAYDDGDHHIAWFRVTAEEGRTS